MVIQQIVDFASVYFIHGYSDGEVPLMILPIINTALKKIFDCNALNAVHRVGLARASLAVGKDCYYALIENQVKDRTHLIKVQFFIGLEFAEGIVKFELRVLNSLGDAVHFVLAVMHIDFWIHHGYHVDLAIGKFLMEDRPLLKADANFHLICEGMSLLTGQPILLSLDHGLEINIDFYTL